ncbi:MAG TPA: hypothetical protein VIY73_15225 [Polyangiaceae bacterium]
METTTHPNATTARSRARSRDLDGLASMDARELAALYAGGLVPLRLGALEGHPRGRMLAVRALDHGTPARLLRSLSGASGFPWGGKSFHGDGDRGEGVNRVHLFGRHRLFPFVTRVQPAVLDGAPCVALDYDLPDNPAAIRAIHDEIREVDPGLFLGPAMWKARGGPRLVLWFGLDTRTQARPIGLPRTS